MQSLYCKYEVSDRFGNFGETYDYGVIISFIYGKKGGRYYDTDFTQILAIIKTNYTSRLVVKELRDVHVFDSHTEWAKEQEDNGK